MKRRGFLAACFAAVASLFGIKSGASDVGAYEVKPLSGDCWTMTKGDTWTVLYLKCGGRVRSVWLKNDQIADAFHVVTLFDNGKLLDSPDIDVYINGVRAVEVGRGAFAQSLA